MVAKTMVGPLSRRAASSEIAPMSRQAKNAASTVEPEESASAS